MERSMISIAREVMDSGHGYVAHETLIEESRRKLHALRGRDALIEYALFIGTVPDVPVIYADDRIFRPVIR